MIRLRFDPLLPALVLFLALGACSFSHSSRSSSKSASSPFKSISRSSGSSGAERRTYQKEVRQFSFAFARSGGDPAAFRRGVGAVAEKHGITNWEEDAETLRSIGAGMRDAGIGETEMRSLTQELVGSDPNRMEQVEKGYQKAR